MNCMDMVMDYIWAFVVGGLFCVIAQILIDKTAMTPARILVMYVCAGVALTAVGLYEPLVHFAGCGATTPLTGFGYSLAKGVQKAIAQYGAVGIITGGMTATAAGVTVALSCAFLAALIFRDRPK